MLIFDAAASQFWAAQRTRAIRKFIAPKWRRLAPYVEITTSGAMR
jgi:hypothetical protein